MYELGIEDLSGFFILIIYKMVTKPVFYIESGYLA